MKKVNLIICGMPHTFREPALSLIESLRELDIHTLVSWNIGVCELVTGDINIYLGSLHGYGFKRNIILPDNSLNIYFCTEQYLTNTTQDNIKYYNDIRDKFDVVVDMFTKYVDKPKISKHRYCPVGWSPIWEENYDPTINETINLFHMGQLQLTTTKRKLNNLVTTRTLYGGDRDRIIQRAKINLSLQTNPNGYEWTQYRMLYTLGKRKFLMSDEHVDYGVYEPSKHFIVFKGNNIQQTYNKWIGRPKLRQNFAMAAYEDIKKNHKYTMYLDKALKGII